jgi:predicted RecB family nuclease
MRQRKVCPKGHVFYKTPGCNTCPRCEAARKPERGFLAGLAAPARHALEGANLTTLSKLAKKTEAQVRELHGMGPNALAKLQAALASEGLGFRKQEP